MATILKTIPLELQNKSTEEAKVQAIENIRSLCNIKQECLLPRFQEAQLFNDESALKTIQLEAQAWKRRQARLLAELDKCTTVEEMGKHLGSIKGYLEPIDLQENISR